MLFEEVGGSKCIQLHIEMRTVRWFENDYLRERWPWLKPVEEAGSTKEQGSSFIVQG